jgi:phosphopantothenoylcysteine synthetase/decarboxylase
MIVGNFVGREGSGFDADTNEVILVSGAEAPVHIEPAPKIEVANRILDQVLSLRLAIQHQ